MIEMKFVLYHLLVFLVFIVTLTNIHATSVRDLPFPILIVNKAMCVEDMTLTYATLRNFDRDETIGMSLFELGRDHPALQKVTAEFSRVFYTKISGIIETEVNGEMWKAKVSPINQSQDSIAIQLFDPSESNELHLQHTAKIFKHLVDNIRDYAVFMLNNEGVVVSWNEGSQRLLGYTENEIIGRHFSILIPTSDNQVEWSEILGIANEKGKFATEAFRLKKDGTQFWASVLVSPVLDDKNVHIGFSKLVRDMTIQLQAETAKDNFMALIQHEIRNLLNSIVVGINLLRQEKLDRDQNELVELIDDSSQSLMTMIDDLLDFSKFHSGFQLQTVIQTIDIHKLVIDLGKQYQMLQPTSNQVAVQYHFNQQIPQYVRTDPMRLQQVLRNLMSNALKFTDKGVVNLDVNLSPLSFSSPFRKEDKSGIITQNVHKQLHIEQLVAIRFQIQDTGIGIERCDFEKLFQSFTQIDSSKTKSRQGTGIGLVISQKIVEMMGGKISFNSEKNVGTTFWFDLVLEYVRPSFEMKLRQNDHDLEPKYDASKMSVLLVEDNKINQKVMIRILQRRGFFDIDIASDGQEAVDLFNDNPHKYHLVLCDISIPVIDGIQVTEIIRRKNKTVPVVAVTGNATLKDQKKCLDAGMVAILTKPINIAKFDEILTRVLSN